MPSTHKWPPPLRKSATPLVLPRDERTHPSYHAARGFIPLTSGARKKYVKAPV